jgi:serine/threonine-protein kinase
MKEDPVSIGRFLVQGALGRGAMGSIYKAHDPDIDRPVAIKLIRADLLESADRDDFIARFRREAQAAGRCSHPNIVAIYDFALHQGNPFLAMEYVDGVTLSQARPAEGRFGVEDAIFVILQVLAALQAAHLAGIVHRDIKPANIMLIGGTRVKVTDFGIARMDTSNLTQRDAIIGTPSYMSPEQCRGEVVDARSDLFSAGIVLFEMLAGCKPFTGSHSTEVLSKLLRDPAPDVRQFAPAVPEALAAVVARSLAKPAAERYASAAEMAAAIKAVAAAVGASYDDRTIIAPGRPATAESRPTGISTSLAGGLSATGSFDPRLLDTLSRKLAELLGPIAPLLVQSAVRRATSVDALCAELESKVDQPAARIAFQQEVRRHLGRTAIMASPVAAGQTSQPGLSATAVTPITQADIDRLQLALARHVGPMAKIMVKRALPAATSAQALWESLAGQITDEAGRTAFLNEWARG